MRLLLLVSLISLLAACAINQPPAPKQSRVTQNGQNVSIDMSKDAAAEVPPPPATQESAGDVASRIISPITNY